MDTSLSALVFDGVQADVRTRAGGSVSNVSNVALSTLASNGSDGSAAGLLQVYPVASFSGVCRGSLVLVFREKRNAAQRVEVVRPLAISWRRRDLDLSVALRSMVFVNETVSLPPRQLVFVFLDRASALLVDARLDVQSVSMAVPRWSDFVLLHRVKSDGGWQVSGELQSSDARWLKTAEVVLTPRTARSQTVTVWTNVTLVDAVSLRSVVVRVSHLVRSMPDPRSLVSTVLQPIVVESRGDEAALVSMADLGALGTSLDSSAVWSEYWSVDVEARGRGMDTSLSALVFDGVQADVRTRAGGSVSNVALSTLASNGSDGSAAGLLQVYPVASFSGVYRGSLVLVFREKRNAAQRVEVVRPLAISWRRRDLDLSVALRSMVFVNETVSLPPRQLVSVALDHASALLVRARLDVQSVSMAVPRWSDFVLLHRVKSDGGWQVSGELQSSDARWLKTAEVVLAPRTAKSQTVTVRTNVTLVDAVSSQSVVVEISHLVRSIPDPRPLVSTALLQPIVVESREDEAALVSMADLGALGTSLDSSAVWSEYWSVDVEVRGRDTDTSLSALVFDGVQADVRTRAGGSVSNVSNVALSTLASNGSDGSAAGLLQVYPVASFSGVFRGSLVLVFREKRNAAQRVEVVCPLAISWRRRDLDLSVALRSMVFVNETVSLPPRQLVSVALDRASALLVDARLDVQSVSMAVPRWSDFVLLHRVKSDGGWQVSGELQSSDARWLKTAEVVLTPRTARSQTVTVWTNVTLRRSSRPTSTL
ncbi:carbohydrate-binding protein, putative [Phytophthora infestans T30-4]|uniref:Carbohydrate-binding protein, putative n=1 Tax=Phytophthora infestans (strain T30-4) TaxID=403677 RepID=D0P0H6_PHYIT|nr:carbohydrate-binding protein, putative [Phytophthora infestans T30-4]EEY52938.1 carbohydrate-binding protein, putative [Phytophthora infestans T30-4]|eukprot:XP_002896205.1 carbohydrate-binding protein, putative [Phytophthora infestans T30-4]